MCGIWCIFGSTVDTHQQLPSCFNIAHRGPDCFRFENVNHFAKCIFGFHRLAIVDDIYGMQPMRLHALPHIWMVGLFVLSNRNLSFLSSIGLDIQWRNLQFSTGRERPSPATANSIVLCWCSRHKRNSVMISKHPVMEKFLFIYTMIKVHDSCVNNSMVFSLLFCSIQNKERFSLVEIHTVFDHRFVSLLIVDF